MMQVNGCASRYETLSEFWAFWPECKPTSLGPCEHILWCPKALWHPIITWNRLLMILNHNSYFIWNIWSAIKSVDLVTLLGVYLQQPQAGAAKPSREKLCEKTARKGKLPSINFRSISDNSRNASQGTRQFVISAIGMILAKGLTVEICWHEMQKMRSYGTAIWHSIRETTVVWISCGRMRSEWYIDILFTRPVIWAVAQAGCDCQTDWSVLLWISLISHLCRGCSGICPRRPLWRFGLSLIKLAYYTWNIGVLCE